MQEDFMREAIRLASENKVCEGGPFGAVIVKDGRIIGRGQNSVIRHLDPSAHAEIVAIRKACRKLGSYYLHGCELYTSCEPCPMCMAAIYWAHLDRVYYASTREDAARAGFDDTLFYAEIAKPIAERKLPMYRLLNKQGEIPFQIWRSNPDKVFY